jgi:HSP20 family protein
MTLMRPRIFPEMPTLREAIDRLFDESFVPAGELLPVIPTERPAIDAYATPEKFIVRVALPGMKAEAIHTAIAGDLLTIGGKHEEATEVEEKGYLRRELSRGELRRSVTLPQGLKVEAAEASYVDGVLTVTIPKLEEVKPREIKVRTT